MKDHLPSRRKKVEGAGGRAARRGAFLRDLRRVQKDADEASPSRSASARKACRLEQRSDLLISTLRNYVKAMEASCVIAEFPDRPPVYLAGLPR